MANSAPSWRARGLLCIWLLAVGCGFLVLADYSSRPGAVGQEPTELPVVNAISLSPHEPTLAVFLHPRCPCSRATVKQLAEIQAGLTNPLPLHFFVYCPAGASEDWPHTDLHKHASTLPRATVTLDISGKACREYGAMTSGHTLLCSPSGEILFSGGVTVSRNHEGENLAASALRNSIRTLHAAESRYPVFGCAILPVREVASHE